jgi:phage RecT family recombinase
MSTAIATRPKNEVQVYLEEQVAEIAVACSKVIRPESVIQVINVLIYRNPKLLECDKPSILHSVIQGVSLGLSFQPSAGEAYLIPRWNDKAKVLECQFQPGYQGLCKLARESGKVAAVQAVLVKQDDTIRVTRVNGEAEVFHEENLSKMGAPITHVYAWAKIVGLEKPLIEIMEIAEVEYIRSRSKSKDSGPWDTDYGEMVKKTAIRRLAKALPKTPKLAAAITAFDSGFELSTGQLEGTEKSPKVDNGTGHGSGKYASPGDVAKYLKAMESYIDKRNQQWLDRWSEKTTDIRDLCNRWQADGHLAKWAEQCGMISPGSIPDGGIKNNQIGRLTAIIYCGALEDRKRLGKELEAYIDKQEQIALVKLQKDHPELFEPIDMQGDTSDDDVLGDFNGTE